MDKTYNNNGYLTQASGPQGTIFTSDEMNALNQYTKYTLGNGIQTENIYNDFGMLFGTETTGIQDLLLNWNTTTGNMIQRWDQIKNNLEVISYDNLNRLTNYTIFGQSGFNVTYHPNSNIETKTDAGIYTYNPNKPHAVESVTDPDNLMPLTQNITYTPFNRPATITEGNYELTFTYGPAQQRKKSVLKNNSVVEKTITYVGNYEKIEVGSDVYEVHYLGNGAINVRKNGTNDQLFYAYTDHLGSILTITNASGTVIYETNFDPWGRERMADTWEYGTNPNKPAWLIRGFTGHEHHPEVQLINMNARLYDPIVGRVLSPDNYVALPDNTQAYNRYSYALNNPLVYVDPDGENHILIAMGISALVGYISGRAAGLRGDDLLFYTLGSAFIGGLSAGIGSAVTSAVGGALVSTTSSTIFSSGTGFAFGAVTGAAGGIAGGFIGGAGMAALSNTVLGTDQDILLAGLGGAAFGGLTGGVVGGIAGGIHARANKLNFWSGRAAPTPTPQYLASTTGGFTDPNAIWGDPGNVDYNGPGLGGTNYVGETTDEFLNQGWPSKDWIDEFAYQHDIRYQQLGASGPLDAGLNQRVIGADIRLVRGANQVIRNYNQGLTFSPGGAYAITQRTYNLSQAVRTSFVALIAYKATSMPAVIYTSIKYRVR